MAQQLLDDEHGREQHLPCQHLAQHTEESQVWWWELEHRARAAEAKAVQSTAVALVLGGNGQGGPDVADPPLTQPLALGGDDQRGDVVEETLGLLLPLDPLDATLLEHTQPQSLAQPLALDGGDQRGDVAKLTLAGPTLLEQPHLVEESPAPPMEQHLGTLAAEREQREKEQRRRREQRERDWELYMATWTERKKEKWRREPEFDRKQKKLDWQIHMAGWTGRKKEIWRREQERDLLEIEERRRKRTAAAAALGHAAAPGPTAAALGPGGMGGGAAESRGSSMPPFKKRLLSNQEPINLCG